MKKDISKLRAHYQGELLDEKNVYSNPTNQFENWFTEALDAKVLESNAMILATASASGIPSLRTVLLKDFNKKGFTFYTNYNSKKAKELLENPHASILFFWPQLHRQIRIEGTVSKVKASLSKKYFKERPRDSQISAWISQQSGEVKSKNDLENAYKVFEENHIGKEIGFPEFWGGFCLNPLSFEFWQGQPNRLHDRVLYSLGSNNKTWNIKRLAP